jgi:hypothetical protein
VQQATHGRTALIERAPVRQEDDQAARPHDAQRLAKK